jgi:hypothetical protein
MTFVYLHYPSNYKDHYGLIIGLGTSKILLLILFFLECLFLECLHRDIPTVFSYIRVRIGLSARQNSS